MILKNVENYETRPHVTNNLIWMVFHFSYQLRRFAGLSNPTPSTPVRLAAGEFSNLKIKLGTVFSSINFRFVGVDNAGRIFWLLIILVLFFFDDNAVCI